MHSDRARPASLEANDVHVRLGGTTAVAGVSVRVEPGACVALVGESGAGKTTLLRCFNRLVVPSSGAILLDGEDVSAQPVVSLRRRIGYVPQDGGLIPHWSVLRNVALVPVLIGQDDHLARATGALQSVGLDPGTFGARFPGELSGGQRQRVAFARAIAARPGVLLMDEPFGALDAVSRFELRSLCRSLRAELSMTTLLVTHDLLEADYMADEIVVMRSGRVDQRGTLGEMERAPATTYVASLLARTLAGTRRTA
jgi:osmoprotectant transport system ATP-binding protein